MFKVNSRETLALLSKRTMKSKRSRNVIAILAITLTTVLFSSIFTIGGGLAQLFQEGLIRQVGGSAHETAQYLSMEEYEKISSYRGSDVREIVYNVNAGLASNEELKKTHVEIRYGSQRAAALMLGTPTEGTLPEKENEIAMGTGILDLLGIPAQIGQQVPLQFTVNGVPQEKTFTLSGFWPTNDHMIWISQACGESVAPPLQKAQTFDGNMDGTLAVDVNFTSVWHANQKMENLLTSVGLDPEKISYRANSAYVTSFELIDIGMIAAVCLLLFIISLSGYLIIYNIFYISVAQDIQFYGLLKTIGMSGRQLKKLVRSQAARLSLIGIPIGALAGYLVGNLLLPSVASQFNLLGLSVSDVTVNPLVLIAASLFSLVTVTISCVRPCRLAARVSPVEAIRYTDTGSSSVRGKKKRSGSCSPAAMALQNMKRSRKKAILVVLSLSLSLTLLNSTYTIVTGFDLDKYVKETAFSDFCVTNYTITNPSAYETDESGNMYKVLDGVTQDFLDKVVQQPGIEFFSNIYAVNAEQKFSDKALSFLENFDGLKPSDVPYFDEISRREKTMASGTDTLIHYGMDAGVLEQLPTLSGTFDPEKWATGDYVLTSDMFHEGRDPEHGFYDVGDTITLENGRGESKDYTVMAVLEVPVSALGALDNGAWGVSAILPSEEFLSFFGQRQPLRTIFDVAPGQLDAMQTWVDGYCSETDTDLSYISRETFKAEFENTKNTFITVGGTLSLTLAVIGLLNFVNAILTSFLARKRELSMLQAIGMSGKQLKSMLICESIAYIAITFLTTATAGSLLGYYLTNMLAANRYAFTYHFTLLPLTACLPVLGVIAAIVPLLFYRSIHRQSIVERLRTD